MWHAERVVWISVARVRLDEPGFAGVCPMAEPPNPVLRRFEPSGAPDPAREPVSVLLDSKWHGVPQNSGLAKFQAEGGRPIRHANR
jgi:hypothetical protein